MSKLSTLFPLSLDGLDHDSSFFSGNNYFHLFNGKKMFPMKFENQNEMNN